VWGWSTQPVPYRLALIAGAYGLPSKVFTPPGFVTNHIIASDNIDELIAMGRDPQLIWGARADALYGLVGTMQRASDQIGHVRGPTLCLLGAKDQIIPRRAALDAARRLPQTARTAEYANGYHLLIRDRQRQVVADDILAFIRDPAAPLPSGAPPIPGTAPAARLAGAGQRR
jgi:pimeloyl-ACP methyl ester carboxylesterase